MERRTERHSRMLPLLTAPAQKRRLLHKSAARQVGFVQSLTHAETYPAAPCCLAFAWSTGSEARQLVVRRVIFGEVSAAKRHGIEVSEDDHVTKQAA